jgi:hypothetical protein
MVLDVYVASRPRFVIEPEKLEKDSMLTITPEFGTYL